MSEAAVAFRTGDESGSLRSDRSGTRLFHAGVPGAPSTYYAANLALLAFPTGEDTRPETVAPVRNLFSRIELQEDPTGYGWFRAPLLYVYTGGANTAELDETDTLDERPEILSSAESPPTALPRTPEGDAAARIRELTALPVEKLAEIFGVSRVAYHNWLKGTRPRGEHRDHLLFTLQLMEEAGRILGTPRNVGAWLIAPSSQSGRVPIELLKNGQYDLCRAVLTHSPASRRSLPIRTKRRLSGADLRAAMERYSPRPSAEDIGLADDSENDSGRDVES